VFDREPESGSLAQPTTLGKAFGGIGSGWHEVTLGAFESVYQALLSYRTPTQGQAGSTS
jgi:hypothetical protein